MAFCLLSLHLMAAVLLGACAATARTDIQPSAPQFNAVLPAPSALRAGMDTFTLLDGSDALVFSPYGNRVLNEFAETSLLFTPNAASISVLSGCAYATFVREVEESEGALLVTPTWDPAATPASGTAWLGLANSSNDRWDWTALTSPGAQQRFEDISIYLDASNQVWLMLLLTPDAGESLALDSIDVRCESGSGWRQFELDNFTTPYDESGDWPRSYLLGTAEVNGLPVVYYAFSSWDAGVQSINYKLAVSSTPSGASADDWTAYDLGPLGYNPAPVSGAEHAYFYLSFPSETELELHYAAASSPDGDFTPELVGSLTHSGEGWFTLVRTARIAGQPAASFAVDLDDNGSTAPLSHYASRDDQGAWSLTQVSAEPLSIVTGTPSGIMEFGGRPLLVNEGISGFGGTFASYPGVALPLLDSDWNTQKISDLEGNSYSILVGSTPSVVTYDVFTGGIGSLDLLRLSGADPLQAGDWTASALDFLPMPNTGGGSAGFSLLDIAGSFGLFVPGAADNMDEPPTPAAVLHTSANPDDQPASWQTQRVYQHDYDNSSAMDREVVRAMASGGQPAYARVYTSTPDGVSGRSVQRLFWAVYEP
ncbi:hypothetical protein IT575_12565 [bacterium]|nr:hypothetical protein [bacterium]